MSNAQWLGKTSRRIEQRIVVEADLVLETPAQFGNGDSDILTDMPLLVDTFDGISPLLTGATLAGALRAYLWSREKGDRQGDPKQRQKAVAEDQKSLTEMLLGAFKQHDDGSQSALIVDNSLGKNSSIQLRDGVRLDPQNRVADEGGLFDMQVWSAGTTFPLRFELLLSAVARNQGESDEAYHDRKTLYFSQIRKALLMALQGLTDGGITLGGRKNRGYGRVSVSEWRVKQYNLLDPSGLMAWLAKGNDKLQETAVSQLTDAASFAEFKDQALLDKRSYFRMEATFSLHGSLLIRANGQPGSHSPDMVHLSNHLGEPVLPGTSVAGALRQRARRILKLVNQANEEKWLNALFGDEEMKGDQFKASRLVVEETRIAQPQFDLVQNRVAIDRFTGGALESALFNEQPVFGKEDTRLYINLTVRDPQKYDIGLLLLLLKDLWTSDLPLGGEVSVGRGRLTGQQAVLTHKEADKKPAEWTIAQKADGNLEMTSGTADNLQIFVDALNGKGVKHGA